MNDKNEMTDDQALLLMADLGWRTVTLLPVLDMCGWTGYAGGFLPYVNWRKSRDLPMALCDLVSSKSRDHILKTRQDIIDILYGGDEKYLAFCKSFAHTIGERSRRGPFANEQPTQGTHEPNTQT